MHSGSYRAQDMSTCKNSGFLAKEDVMARRGFPHRQHRRHDREYTVVEYHGEVIMADTAREASCCFGFTRRGIPYASVVVLFGVLSTGCSLLFGGGSPFSRPLWVGSSSSTSQLDLDGNLAPSLMEVATGPRSISGEGIDENNKVFFRSSDVEFWSFGSVDQIAELSSWGNDHNNGGSLKYTLGDRVESVVFYPGSSITNDLSNDLNPTWAADVASFLSSDMFSGEINMCRLDIGSGHVEFVVEGELLDVELEGLPATNCLLFVDEEFLSDTYLVTDETVVGILTGEVDSAALGMTEADFDVVHEIVSHGARSDDYRIDVDGVLVIPFTPFDVGDYDPETDSLVIELTWDMDSAIYGDLESYYMTDRVAGTCFDFTVAIKKY